MGAMGAILISFYLSLFAYNYASASTLAPQCDTTASQRHKLTQEHCDSVLASFVNYGNWMLNTKPVASQSCRRCEIVVESLTQYGIRAPMDVIKYSIYSVLNSCGARGGSVQLDAGTGETFGPYPKMLVRVRQGEKGRCPVAKIPVNGDDDDDDDDDMDSGWTGNSTGSGFGGGSRSGFGGDSGSRIGGGRGSGIGRDSGSGTGGGSRSGIGGDSTSGIGGGRGSGIGRDSGSGTGGGRGSGIGGDSGRPDGTGRGSFSQNDDTDDPTDTGTTTTPRTRGPQGAGGASTMANQRSPALQRPAGNAQQGIVPAITSGLKGLLG